MMFISFEQSLAMLFMVTTMKQITSMDGIREAEA